MVSTEHWHLTSSGRELEVRSPTSKQWTVIQVDYYGWDYKDHNPSQLCEGFEMKKRRNDYLKFGDSKFDDSKEWS